MIFENMSNKELIIAMSLFIITVIVFEIWMHRKLKKRSVENETRKKSVSN